MGDFTHFDRQGVARMVDISSKGVSCRRAKAKGQVSMTSETIAAVRDRALPKGDVLAVARTAGIQAAKRTADLIPMCHPLPLDGVRIDFEIGEDGIQVVAEAWATAKTGVEMEALSAASIACLTIYDMCKSADRRMRIGDIGVTMKKGGRHDFTA